MPLPLIERVLILEQELVGLRSLAGRVSEIEGMLTEFNAQRVRLKEKMKKARKGRNEKKSATVNRRDSRRAGRAV